MTEETLEKLAQLLEQDQFELLIPEKMRTESGRCGRELSGFSKCSYDGGISQRLSGRTAGIHDQAGWQICACHKTG